MSLGEELTHSNAHHLMMRIGKVYNTTADCSELLILGYGALSSITMLHYLLISGYCTFF